MCSRSRKERVESVWLRKLHQAELAYGIALAETRRVQADLPSMSSADGNLALQRVLKGQSEAAAEYARVQQTFTRLILYGEGETPAIEVLDDPTPSANPDAQE